MEATCARCGHALARAITALAENVFFCTHGTCTAVYHLEDGVFVEVDIYDIVSDLMEEEPALETRFDPGEAG